MLRPLPAKKAHWLPFSRETLGSGLNRGLTGPATGEFSLKLFSKTVEEQIVNIAAAHLCRPARPHHAPSHRAASYWHRSMPASPREPRGESETTSVRFQKDPPVTLARPSVQELLHKATGSRGDRLQLSVARWSGKFCKYVYDVTRPYLPEWKVVHSWSDRTVVVPAMYEVGCEGSDLVGVVWDVMCRIWLGLTSRTRESEE